MLDLVPSREDFVGKSIRCHCQLYFLLLFLLENFDNGKRTPEIYSRPPDTLDLLTPR